jgi:hypothetical protein
MANVATTPALTTNIVDNQSTLPTANSVGLTNRELCKDYVAAAADLVTNIDVKQVKSELDHDVFVQLMIMCADWLRVVIEDESEWELLDGPGQVLSFCCELQSFAS